MSSFGSLSQLTDAELAQISPQKSACDKVSSGVGIVPFGSPRSRNQVSFGENWALHHLSA